MLKLKKGLYVMLAVVLLAALMSAAAYADDIASGYCGADTGGLNLSWTLSEYGRLTVSGSGKMASYKDSSKTPWAAHLNEIKAVTLESGITSIGNYAFSSCVNLSGINLPTGLTDIGDYAFEGCETLTPVEFPSTLKNINGSAFKDCAGLNVITCKAANTLYYVKNNCLIRKEDKTLVVGTNKSIIPMSDGIVKIDAYAFSKRAGFSNTALPETVNEIGANAFYNCPGVKNAVFTTRVKSIGANAFYNCTGLTSVDLANGINSLGENAFYGCKNVVTLLLGTGISAIPKSAFYRCSGLTEVTVPAGVKSIEESAFGGCSGIRTVTLPKGLLYIKDQAFIDCSSMTDINYPYGLKSIGEAAFQSCSSLKNADVPQTVTSMGMWAFVQCSSVTSAVIPDSLTRPATFGYRNNKNLKTVTIGAGITEIQSWTFENCNAIQDIYYVGTQEEWKKINIEKENGSLKNATVHYVPKIEEGYCGADGNNVKWSLTHAGILTITGSGAMKDFASAGAPWYAKRENIREVTVAPGVTSVGNYSFYNCPNIIKATLYDNVAKIGNSAFSGCSSLVNIDLREGLGSIGSNAFTACYSLQEINLPKTLFEIGSSAFSSCTALIAITIPNDIEKIENSTFSMCTSLFVATLPKKLKSIGPSAFYGCSSLLLMELPDTVVSIGSGAFRNCGRLTSINLSRDLTSIENNAFQGCESLGDIVIPDGVKYLGDYVFADCKKLSTVIFSKALESVGASAFLNCSSLQRADMPDSLVSLGEKAFSGCSVLFAVTLLPRLTEIPDGAFKNCAALSNVIIPSEVKSVRKEAFMGCAGLETVTFGTQYAAGGFSVSKLNDIGIRAFSGCTALGDVYYYGMHEDWGKVTVGSYNDPLEKARLHDVIYGDCGAGEDADQVQWGVLENAFTGSGTTLIIMGDGAMADYKNTKDVPWKAYAGEIESVQIMGGVTHIGDRAFANCTALTEVIFDEDAALESIGINAFYGCEKLNGVILPDTTAYVRSKAFYNCTALSEITFPAGLTGVGNSAFELTPWLDAQPQGVIYAGNVAIGYKGELPKDKKITFKNTTTGIGDFAFASLSGLAETVLPDSVRVIGESAFAQSGLKKVTFGKGLARIEKNAFAYCSGLEAVSLPDSVAAIGEKAFYSCANLKSAAFGKNLEKIDPYAFYCCSALEQINLPGKLSEIGEYAFSETSVKQIVIPGSVGKIGENAFSYTGLTEITVPESVESIGRYAFASCSSLKSAVFEGRRETIPDYIFNNCSALAQVSFTNSVKNVGKAAFLKCNGLTDVYFVGTPADREKISFGGFNKPITDDSVTWHYLEALDGTRVTLSKTSFTYNGEVQKPTVTVKNAAGDTLKENTDYIVIYASGCKDVGKYTVTVTGKNNYAGKLSKEFNIVKHDPHTWDAGVVKKAATCAAEGEKLFTCTYCKTTKTEPISKNANHNWGDWVKLDDTQHRRVCKNDAGHVEKANHTWDGGKVTKAAACTAAGEKTYTCTVCKATKKETVSALKHNYGAWTKLDDTQHRRVCKNDASHVEKANHTWDGGKITKEATADAEGVKTYTCTVCGATKTEKISKTAAAYIIGDVDDDKKVLAADARSALRAAVGLDDTKEGLDFSSKTSRCFLAADITRDGVIRAEDARLILRAAVGLCDLNDPATW